MSVRLDYDAFYRLLADSVSEVATCTIFGRTDSNHSVIIGLDRGRIVCLRCGARKGMEAVAALREMQTGTFRVDDSLLELHSTAPPPTADLIAALHPTHGKVPASDATERHAGVTFDAAAVGSSLCSIVSDYLGPVAPIVCEEKIAEVGGLRGREELEAAIRNLAWEIDDSGGEADRFVMQARATFESILT